MTTYKPISDPFIGKGPIPAGISGFYEREEIFTNTQNLLRAGESVSLVGERKAGKTSFLNYLSVYLSADEFMPVFVDTQKVLPKKDKLFLGRLIKLAAQVIEKTAGLAQPIEIDTPTLAPDEEVYEAFENDLERLRAKLPPDKIGRKRRLIWLIDEIEILRSYEKTNLFAFLRSYAQSDPDFRIVVAGHDVLYTLSNRSEWSPFFNAFRHIRLEGLNPIVAKKLIDDALTKMQVTLESNLYPLIFAWTGRKPYYLKWILSKIAEALNRRQTSYHISADIFQSAQTLFLNERDLNSHFVHLWEAHTTSRQQIVLSLISSQTGPYNYLTILDDLKEKKLVEGDRQATQHLIDDLTRLQQLGFLYKQAGEYTFTSDCLKTWIKKTKPLR